VKEEKDVDLAIAKHFQKFDVEHVVVGETGRRMHVEEIRGA